MINSRCQKNTSSSRTGKSLVHPTRNKELDFVYLNIREQSLRFQTPFQILCLIVPCLGCVSDLTRFRCRHYLQNCFCRTKLFVPREQKATNAPFFKQCPDDAYEQYFTKFSAPLIRYSSRLIQRRRGSDKFFPRAFQNESEFEAVKSRRNFDCWTKSDELNFGWELSNLSDATSV